MRNYSPLDDVLLAFDQGLRTLLGRPAVTERPNPAAQIGEEEMSAEERELSGRLMRINHTGEVCAQALYQGQALTARQSKVRRSLERAAAEENDHLDWCERRLDELGGRKSYLNPLWYAGALGIGAVAGLAGDRWSLGFVAETEHQVGKHLDEVLDTLLRTLARRQRDLNPGQG